jgi:arsenate reductase
MSTFTIFHNPRCGTSRTVLQALRDAGHEPQVIEYLKTPPDAQTLQRLAADSGEGLRGLLRAKEPLCAELGLEGADDARLLQAMLAHPVLLNRPVVVGPKGTALCRPADKVQALL